jgi:hypothetical protein
MNKLMTIEEARELLWEEYKESTDEEIQKIIDLVKTICSITIEDYLSTKKPL